MRPVGSTSGRPRVGAPDGPGSRNRPASAVEDAPDLGLPATFYRGPDALLHLAEAPRGSAATARGSGAPRRRARVRVLRGVPRCRQRSATASWNRGQRQGAQARAPVQASAQVRNREDRKPSRARSRASARVSEALPPCSSPRGTRTRAHEQVVELVALRAAPEDVQAVANLHLLELAEIGVELGERFARVLAGRDAAVPVESDSGDQLEDVVAQDVAGAAGPLRRPRSTRPRGAPARSRGRSSPPG